MSNVQARRQPVRNLILAVVVAGTAALLVPFAALAGGGEDPLRVRFEPPLIFDEGTPECPEGVVHFGISALGKSGSATNCLQDSATVECPPTVEALFCLERNVLMTLRLQGGKIKAQVALFEIWNCGDPDCLTLAIDQQWPGTVVYAKGRFNKLKGATVSGGGTAVFDAATFELLSLDEEIVIGEED